MVPLKNPVPVYITYLTAMPDANGSSIAYFDDVYGRDKAQVASAASPAEGSPASATGATSSGNK